ncbi:hypothetical protein [Sneathiella chinensis]|uniref:DUF2946 domain-containing protein n=1 Tax=Sneathiella chinensis TaxID=349750 RepID=A0ABQ5U5N2_9PROT|nr:hypothetical protein [Sneathiella chinensis]GLQ07444.1 hypothetical protein GCM10007924_26650 [Sneathiella chinensis]
MTRHSPTINRKIQIMAFAMLVAFVTSLFSVIPTSLSHAKNHEGSHIMSVQGMAPAPSPENTRHMHMEKCGMTSCSVSVPAMENGSVLLAARQVHFTDLNSIPSGLDLAPPGRPPSA